MKQAYTSANTSINSTKAPAIYSKRITKSMIKGKKVLDYGGGKFDTGIKAGMSIGAKTVQVYDPYNRSEEHNNEVLKMEYDVVICSNVLNVIKEKEVRESILKDMASKAKTLLITVYEGNGSGIGKQSKADCWQENRKLSDYLEEVKSATGYSVKIQNGVIIAEG